MPTHIVRLVIDSRDRTSGQRNNATFQIPWASVTKWDEIEKIDVRAQFCTCGGAYATTTPPDPPAAILAAEVTNYLAGQLVSNSTCSVRMGFNAGVESITSNGSNARDNHLFSARRDTFNSLSFWYESNKPILELRSPPQGLTEISLIRGGSTDYLRRTVTDAGLASSGVTTYLADDSSDWILVLFLEIHQRT